MAIDFVDCNPSVCTIWTMRPKKQASPYKHHPRKKSLPNFRTNAKPRTRMPGRTCFTQPAWLCHLTAPLPCMQNSRTRFGASKRHEPWDHMSVPSVWKQEMVWNISIAWHQASDDMRRGSNSSWLYFCILACHLLHEPCQIGSMA